MQLDRQNKNDLAQNDESESEEVKKEEDKTRKKSDRNMNNYRKIVVADDSDNIRQYASDYRGRVQDRNVAIQLEPMYALTYYEKVSEIRRIVHYHKLIEKLFEAKQIPAKLHITNREAPLTEDQVNLHFEWVNTHTSDILGDNENAIKRFVRGMDFYLVQDFSSAIEDFTKATLLDSSFFPAYFMRAIVRYKELEYQRAEEKVVDVKKSGEGAPKLDYEMVVKDLKRVIELQPDFVYAYYNLGNIFNLIKDYRAALIHYDKAIQLNPDFAEAYFNRGLTKIFLGENREGVADLSKAGELGIYSAYNVIKRFTDIPD